MVGQDVLEGNRGHRSGSIKEKDTEGVGEKPHTERQRETKR